MIDLDFFKNFLEKYKITNYNRINYPSTSREAKRQLNREIIFNIDDNCYYKIINTKLTLLDVHYFLNNAYFPNHFVSSIYDTELSLWIVKQTPSPGLLLLDMLKNQENKLDKSFIIQTLEWFKWQHIESRRIFPEETDKYFMCIGSGRHGGRHDGNADLSPHNIIYNIDTDQFTIIDFESLEPWQHWYNKDDYVSFVFGGMIRLLDFFRRHNDIFNFISNKDYPELLNYCFQYIDKEIV